MFRYEDFQLRVWREFRELSGAWPTLSIVLHYLSWALFLILLIAGVLVAARKDVWLGLILWVIGTIEFPLFRLRLVDRVLLREWRKKNAANRDLE
jgi:hypothetical protein